MHIRVDDTVEVITGEDRGTRGKVLKVLRAQSKLVVEGVNRVYRHVRRGPRNTQGGRLSKEMPISWSNVLLVCTACGRPARTGARLREDGGKDRYCKKCQAAIGVIAVGAARKNRKAEIKAYSRSHPR